MRLFRALRMRLLSLFGRRRADAELDAEIQFHFEQQFEENVTRGMAPQEERYAALRAIGGIAQFKEECRNTRGVNWIENLAGATCATRFAFSEKRLDSRRASFCH